MTDEGQTATMSPPGSVRLRGPPRLRPGCACAHAPLEPRSMVTAGGSHRPGVAARGAGDLARGRPDPGASRPHDGLALHVLPRSGTADGRRPRPHPEQRPDRPAVRRRAPVELRAVRERRAPPRLRHQRLRRDAPGPVRVGRQAAGGELRDRRALSRVHRRGAPRDHARRRARATASRCCSAAESGVLESWYDHLDVDKVQSWLQRRAGAGARRRSGRSRRSTPSSPRRARGTACRRSRSSSRRTSGQMRIVADPPLIVPVEDLFPDGVDAEDTVDGHARHPRRVPADAASRANHPLAEFTLRAHGEEGRRGGQRRHARVDRAAAWPRRRGPAVPPGEGGPGVRARAIPRAVRVREPGRARRARPAHHAGLERHLPRLAARPGRGRCRARLLHAAASRLEGILRRRAGSARAEPCCMHASAARRSRARTRVRATASRSPRTSGKSDTFEESIADFAEAYADQNDADYAAFTRAIESGRLEAVQGL